MYESTIIVTFYKKMALVNAFSKYFTSLSNIVEHGPHVWGRVSRVLGSVSDTSESHCSVWLPVTALLQNTANYLIDGLLREGVSLDIVC